MKLDVVHEGNSPEENISQQSIDVEYQEKARVKYLFSDHTYLIIEGDTYVILQDPLSTDQMGINSFERYRERRELHTAVSPKRINVVP